MKKEAVLTHPTDLKKIMAWMWHSWMEAQAEAPVLRWLGAAALALAGLAIYMAASEGESALRIAVDGAVGLSLVLLLPVIIALLFEISRKHRSDAMHDSKRLSELIRKISMEEMRALQDSNRGLDSAREYLGGRNL
jgi:hypothetical protein